jgi:hypothetical protein
MTGEGERGKKKVSVFKIHPSKLVVPLVFHKQEQTLIIKKLIKY